MKEKNQRSANIRFAVILAVAAVAMYVGIMLKTAKFF